MSEPTPEPAPGPTPMAQPTGGDEEPRGLVGDVLALAHTSGSAPRLAPVELPSQDWAGWVRTTGNGGLVAAGQVVATLKETAPGDTVAIQLWNDAWIELSGVLSVASLVAQVHPDPAVVEVAEALEVEGRRFTTDLMLDPEVFARLESIEGLVDAAEGAGRVLADALRAFRRSGVDRDEDVRARLRDLDERDTALGQAFSRGIRDGRRTTRVPVTALAALPEDFRESHPADNEGLVAITTEYPDTHPFLTHSRDAEARRQVAHSFFNLAWPGNDAVLAEMLEVRHEQATTLGYASWPDFDAEVKMIGSAGAIGDFVEQTSADAERAARRDVEILREQARLDGEPDAEIDLSSWRHLLEAVKRERYGVDAQAVRRYFDFPAVRQGLLDVTARLFGLTYVEVDDAAVWHEEVTTYDVLLEGRLIGRIHLDLHPRERKYNHAAQFDLRSGVLGRQLPEGVLVCNFPRGLMDHRDVVTLFHEFGHLMHHTLAGRHPWVRFSGVATEWDFVEAPSQMLEEWAWDAGVLQSFARNAEGAPIPTELVEKMRAAEDFGKGFLARTQMFYAAVSYRFHLERPADLTARLLELYEAYSMAAPLPDTHFHAGFGHLGGYTSAYYTYMWSQVIAKDMFSAFDGEDIFAPEVAHRYRDRVLAPGGSKDAADLVEDFLGRPYDSRAFKAWLER